MANDDAFNDFASALRHAYGRPPLDAADTRSQHVDALIAIAHFLERMGPDYLVFADQFVTLAQMLQDVNDGIPVPDFIPARAYRRDPTMVWYARACVARAVETMRQLDHSRKSAAEWAAKRYPDLKQLITEEPPHRAEEAPHRAQERQRSNNIETVIVSWCRAFSRRKVRNPRATEIYSIGLDKLNKLKARGLLCNSDQIEEEADRLLRKALDLICRRS